MKLKPDIKYIKDKISPFRKWHSNKPFRYKLLFYTGLIAFLVVYGGYICPPKNFPAGKIITIEEGTSLHNIAKDFEEQDIVRNSIFFSGTVGILFGQKSATAGDYYFSKKKNVLSVAYMVAKGKYGLDPIVVTVPEGISTFEMAELFEYKLSGFDADKFIKIAQKYEGYLFPDTYHLLPNTSERQIINMMRDTFNKKITEVVDDIEAFGVSLEEAIIMASLLEKEARTIKTWRIIAGILWKRIDIGMALQVDAVFPYIIGKNTFQLTIEDLNYDSPYNTYKYPGLPKGPIANPGLESILAAVTPIETNYLYYLSDMEGNMHYATNFEGHKWNKRMYLR